MTFKGTATHRLRTIVLGQNNQTKVLLFTQAALDFQHLGLQYGLSTYVQTNVILVHILTSDFLLFIPF